MNTKIKLLSIGIVALMGVFGGANLALAQNATITTCTTATMNGTITDTNGIQTSAWFEWGANSSNVSSGYGTKTATQLFSTPQTFNQVIYGLSPSTTYYYRAVVSNTRGKAEGSVLSFTTSACTTAATVTTNSASAVTQNSATLNGYVTSSGTNTNTWFEWGTTQSYGNTTPSANYGTTATSFSNSIFNLSQNTTYYYRAVAQNSQGTVYGSAVSFTTTGQGGSNQTSVTTSVASAVMQNSAILNGYVTSNGTNTNTWFEWGTSYSLGNTTPSLNYGVGSTSFSNSLYGLAPSTTYYYRAAAQSAYGTVYGNTLSFTTSGQGNNNNYSQPYVSTNVASSITQNSATVNGYLSASGGINTSAWFEWGTTYSLGNTTSYISYGSGSTSFNSSLFSLAPNTTYYYRAAVQSSYGTVYGSILSFTTTGQSSNNNTYGSTPTATTLLATELTGSTARLNGLVFASADQQASSAWFEWGTTSSLGSRTQTTNVGSISTVRHSDYITGLTRGQTYYYRIAAQNSYGTVYGGVNTFVSNTSTTYVAPTTTNTVVLRPITTVITQGSGVQSLVTLSINGGADAIGSGEKRTYQVSWKNTSTQSLKNVVLRVTFPLAMNIDSATRGSFSTSDNSVVVDLKTLAPGESGDTFIFATSGRSLKPGELLVVTANMVFTGTNGVQGDAIAYVTHTVEATQSALGASVFGAGSFLPTNLFEWVLFIIMILILVLLGNHLYGRFAGER